MNYKIEKNKIIVLCNEFNPKDIFECGQVFSYKKIDDETYLCFPCESFCAVYKENENFVIEVLKGDVKDFVEYFDLERDYFEIIEKINKLETCFNKDFIQKATTYGRGIRILRQNKLETIISFIFSANNNIKRFTNSLNILRKEQGNEIIFENQCSNKKIQEILGKDKFFSFPTLEKLLCLDENYFSKIGAGYRAPYLKETITLLLKFFEQDFSNIETCLLEKQLLGLKGVGLKVAMCVMLFGFGHFDVFPVDTWIKKVFLDLKKTEKELSANEISRELVNSFKELSGFAQQYLFYYKRSLE